MEPDPERRENAKKRKKDLKNPFMLQFFFTTQNRRDTHLQFLITLLKLIKDVTSSKGYVEKAAIRREIIDKAASEADVKFSYDKSKVLNDLLRLGVLIGGEVREGKFYSLDMSLAFDARYVAISTWGEEVLNATSREAQRYSLAVSYVNNYVIQGILTKYVDLYGSRGVLEVSRRNEKELYASIIEPAVEVLLMFSKSLEHRNPRLSTDLSIIAELLRENENMQKKFVRSVLVPLSLLTDGKAINVTRGKVTLNIEEISKLLKRGIKKKVDLKSIVKAYCEIVKAAGFRLEDIDVYGPEVSVKALANILEVNFEYLNSLLQELSKYESDLIYEIAVALPEDDLSRFIIRAKPSLIRKFCLKQ